MANFLGVPSYDPALDVENMRIQSGLVQQLGQQVRNDITTIQTNRQLSGLAQGLQGLNPETKDFGQQAVGLMMQYPLAAKSPIGTAAISQLGAQHKLWQQEELRKTTADSYFNIPGTDTLVSRKTGNTRELPAGTSPRKPVQIVKDAYGNVTTAFDPNNLNQELALPDAPMKTSQDAVELEKLKQQDRMDIRKSITSPATPQERAIGSALSKATVDYGKTKSEVDRLQSLWEQIPEDDQPSFMDPTKKNRDLKYQAGVRANALRKQLVAQESQVKTLAEQLKSFRAQPIIPGLTPADVNPAPDSAVGQVGSAVNPESLIPAGIPEPSLAPKRRRFSFDGKPVE